MPPPQKSRGTSPRAGGKPVHTLPKSASPSASDQLLETLQLLGILVLV